MSFTGNPSDYGQNGFDVITSASGEVTGEWYVVKPTNGTVEFTTCLSSQGDHLSGEVIDNPTPGLFTKIEVASGTCLAYRTS